MGANLIGGEESSGPSRFLSPRCHSLGEMRFSFGLPVPERSEIPAGLWGLFLTSKTPDGESAALEPARRQRCKLRASQASPQMPSRQTPSRVGKGLAPSARREFAQRGPGSPARGRGVGQAVNRHSRRPEGAEFGLAGTPHTTRLRVAPFQCGWMEDGLSGALPRAGGLTAPLAPGWARAIH